MCVDETKKLQITLKDRNLYKIKGGYITEVEPTRVPRIIGKKGSMIAVIKKYIRCRIFVGQNGRIWIDGDTEAIEKVQNIIQIIEQNSISYGLTNRIESLLKKDARSAEISANSWKTHPEIKKEFVGIAGIGKKSQAMFY